MCNPIDTAESRPPTDRHACSHARIVCAGCPTGGRDYSLQRSRSALQEQGATAPLSPQVSWAPRHGEGWGHCPAAAPGPLQTGKLSVPCSLQLEALLAQMQKPKDMRGLPFVPGQEPSHGPGGGPGPTKPATEMLGLDSRASCELLPATASSVITEWPPFPHLFHPQMSSFPSFSSQHKPKKLPAGSGSPCITCG